MHESVRILNIFDDNTLFSTHGVCTDLKKTD